LAGGYTIRVRHAERHDPGLAGLIPGINDLAVRWDGLPPVRVRK
jgi:hypothetical protein